MELGTHANVGAQSRPVVAAFDFDGTVTRGDSLLPFLHFAAGTGRFVVRMAASLPTLAGYAAGWIRNDLAKEWVLQRFFSGMPIATLNIVGANFARERLPALVRPEAIARLNWHREQRHRCVLVSASLQLYLQPWANAVGFDHVIGSELELRSGRFVTGRLAGGNCHGAEKLRRLQQLLGPRSGYYLYAYGDSRGDSELLAAADSAYFRTMPSPGEGALR